MKKRRFFRYLTGLLLVVLLAGSWAIPAQAGHRDLPVGVTPSGIPLSQIEEVVDDFVSGFIGITTPGAAIAVVKDGQIVFSKGYGYADIDRSILVEPETTIFEWASISKLFTWTAVMQLVEEGRLDTDTDIARYLPPDFVAALSYDQPIALRDIMNHAAGFGDYAFNAIVFSPGEVVPLEEAILRDRPEQYYEVGTASAYSNYATSLAGYVVQTVRGKPFEEHLRERIFHPLSMDGTSAHPLLADRTALTEQKAQGYLPDPQGGFQPGRWSYVSHLPAGSVNGTVEDLARFAIALTPAAGEHSPLFGNPETLDVMLSPSYDPGDGMVGTAHGFFQYRGAYPTFGHGGNTASFSGQFAVVPQERFGIAILANAQLEMELLFGLQELLLGKDRTDTGKPDKDLPAAGQVSGRYVPVERQEGNFVDFAMYINLYQVRALDEHTITMSIGPFEGTYTQTGPYLYELVEDNHPVFRNIYPLLRFQMEEETVKRVVIGNGMDLSPLPPGRTMPFLIGSIVVLAGSLVFFILAPIAALIVALKHRKRHDSPAKQPFVRLVSAMVVLGTIALINNLIPTTKIMISSFHTFSAMKPHILFNYLLLAGALIGAARGISLMKKTVVTRKQKCAAAITATCLFLFFALLFHWNFFAVVG